MITEEGWRSKVKHVYVHNDSDYNLNVCVCVYLASFAMLERAPF